MDKRFPTRDAEDVHGVLAADAQEEPRCLAIAEAGIRTGAQYAAFMSAIMADSVSGRLGPAAVNAAVNAGGKLLKVVEMQFKYGNPRHGRRDISLVVETPEETAAS